jgi:hypothetical protein
VPNRRSHVAKFRHNERLSRTLEGTPNNDWAVTLLFYSALHLVDACLAPAQHPKRHADRRNLAANNPLLQPIWAHYRVLEDRSQEARYDCIRFSDQRVRDLRSQHFEPLKRHLSRILGI